MKNWKIMVLKLLLPHSVALDRYNMDCNRGIFMLNFISSHFGYNVCRWTSSLSLLLFVVDADDGESLRHVWQVFVLLKYLLSGISPSLISVPLYRLPPSHWPILGWVDPSLPLQLVRTRQNSRICSVRLCWWTRSSVLRERTFLRSHSSLEDASYSVEQEHGHERVLARWTSWHICLVLCRWAASRRSCFCPRIEPFWKRKPPKF